jgi:hypothetical protein
MSLVSLRALVAAGLLLWCAGGPVGAQAPDATAWDAAWVGGWNGGEDSQVVIAGGVVIGFFWHGRHFTIESSTNLADGQPIRFLWPGGDAVVQLGPHGELLLLIRETGKPQTGFTLTRQ